MHTVYINGQEIPLEKTLEISKFDNESRVMQRDYLNAIMSVRVEKEVRAALSKVDVRDGEHHLDTWVVNGKGVYVGSWSKRLAKFVYKEFQIKLDPQVVSVISERIARTLSGSSVDLAFKFSRERWQAGEFGEKTDSCWFDGRSYSYCLNGLLDSEGGGAIKFYDVGKPRARCWFYNLEDNLLIFNAYDKQGQLDILSMARLMSNKFSADYHRHMQVIVDAAYVNGKSVYAVGNPPIERPITLDFAMRNKISLPRLSSEPVLDIPNNRSCPNCRSDRSRLLVTEDGRDACEYCTTKCANCHKVYMMSHLYMIYNGDYICADCCIKAYTTCDSCSSLYPKNMDKCPNCGTEFWCSHCEEDCTGERYTLPDGDYICQDCYDDSYRTCDRCENIVYYESMTNIDDDTYVCDSCRDDYYTQCYECNNYFDNDEISECRGRTYCEACANQTLYMCERCGAMEHTDYTRTIYINNDMSREETWCEECSDAHSTYCENCNETYASVLEHNCAEDDDED